MGDDDPRVKIKPLVVHGTREGMTIPMYRDNDLKGHLDAVRMVYVTTVNPGERKGPILHKRRKSTVMPVRGNPTIMFHMTKHDEDARRLYICPLYSPCSDGGPLVAEIPPGVAVEYVNTGTDVAVFLVIADYAWRPNDDESVKYCGWDDYYKARG